MSEESLNGHYCWVRIVEVGVIQTMSSKKKPQRAYLPDSPILKQRVLVGPFFHLYWHEAIGPKDPIFEFSEISFFSKEDAESWLKCTKEGQAFRDNSKMCVLVGFSLTGPTDDLP